MCLHKIIYKDVDKMYVLKIEGNKNLKGTVKISGAKNSAVALIPAAILCDENVNVFPFLYAYFLDNCETPPTLLSIVQNQQKHSRHALAMCHSQRY